MTATNYANCLAITLDYEGGYSNDPGDPGGPTKYGITIHDVRLYLNAHASAADVKALTLEQAKVIYQKHYWEPVSGDVWPDGLDLSVFDAGVNSGLGRADKWARDVMAVTGGNYSWLAARARAQASGTIVAWIKAYSARRLSFLHALRTWRIFGKGWGRRVSGIEALGVKMALLAAKLTVPEVKKRLEEEAGAAKGAAKKTGGGAATTGVGAGGVATQIDWAHLSPYLSAVAFFAVAAVAVYFVWWINHHAARSQAYAAAAASVGD